MDKWFNSKWFVRGVSLAFAILLYVFVNIEVTTTDSRIPGSSDKVQTLNDVPVDIRIDSEKYVVSGVPEFAAITFEGPNSIMTPTVMQRNFDLYVDLQELGEGTHTVDIEHARIPEELTVYIDPKTIEVTIEERATKDFPVSVDLINKDQIPAGHELGDVEVNPKTVTITSSRSTIESIAMVKVYIDVAGLTESISNREIPVNVYDNQGNGLNVRIQPEGVVVSVDVDNPSKVIPIEVNTKGDLDKDFELKGITPDVDEIEIFAASDILEELENIQTEEIDLSEIKESGTINVNLKLPDGAFVVDETIKVDIEIEKKAKDD